ncbi:type III PLP-dependent enzyme [Streptomyces sp. NPDC001185]|uniref:type III PLP-dependent enzyme n=1 Tax=Streptomyces sp. NPDC001185 TaxID=3154380 RepID=UPI00332332C3
MTVRPHHRDLAERYGTPLYVYDRDRVRAARRDLFGCLPEGVEVYYAFKANPHPDLVRALRTGDGPACKAEISSTGELATALEAGYRGEDILYTGPGKTPSELDAAVRDGVDLFSAESLSDLEHIGRAALGHGTTARCLLRINSVTASAASGVRMTGKPTQFGIDSETLPEIAAALTSMPGTSVEGLHLFSQSNARDEESLLAEFRHTLQTAARIQDELGLRLRVLDIGGGFSVPYGRNGERAAYPKLRGELAAALDVFFPGWRHGLPRIAVESGRYLVGDSGHLVTAVSNVKSGRGHTFAVCDAGINVFGGMSGLGRLLPVSVEVPVDEESQQVTLAGPLCTPGDVLGRGVTVPADLAPGDLLAVPNTGAYGPTASLLMFLGRPSPVEVVTDGEETVSVTRIERTRVPYAAERSHD